MTRILLLLCLSLFTPIVALACGPESRCQIGDRHYYIALPPGYSNAAQVPAVLFAHGLQGTALGTIRNERLRAAAAEQGVALIAIKSRTADWSIPGSPEERADRGAAELAYVDAVIADATARFSLDRDRFVMAGASVGGMFTWYLACNRSDRFAAFIPMSGTFWTPEPRRCNDPVTNILHFHGDNDRTVPLQGRVARGYQQGSVTKALSLYKRHGDFGRPDKVRVGDMTCDMSRNRDGKLLGFCLYPGRHAFRSANLGIALRMLRRAGQL